VFIELNQALPGQLCFPRPRFRGLHETLVGGQGLPLGVREPAGMNERDADVDAHFVDAPVPGG
jgi:hypothetical protein